MQSRNPYGPDNQPPTDNQSQSLDNSRVANTNLVRENERLQYERLRQNEAIRNNNLARENERLRYDRADQESSNAVGGLLIGLLVFALAALGLGAFYYLGRDTGAQEVLPTPQAQPQSETPNINITTPQQPTPQVTVQPPDVNVQTPAPPPINIQVPAPAGNGAASDTAPSNSSSNSQSTDSQTTPSTAPGTSP